AAPQLETHAHPLKAHAHPRPEELAVSVDHLGLISLHHQLPRRLCLVQNRYRRK
ncbi:hypothetical protein Tco_0406673, partial [Tanacetum coccineum]